MELLVVFFGVGAAAYFLIKGNTNRGFETVRASIFLGGIQARVIVAEANYVASCDVLSIPSEAIENATEQLQAEYGGKQLSMIADAYSQGMIPRLPFLYRLVAGLRTDNLPMRHRLTQEGVSPDTVKGQSPEWVEAFVLYFIASEFVHAPPGELPTKVRELIHAQPSRQTQQSLLVHLQLYLQHAHGRDRRQEDLGLAVVEAGVFLRAELQTLNSSLALKQFLRRLQAKSGNSPLPEYELEKQAAKMVAEIKNNNEFAQNIRIKMLKDSVDKLFEETHRGTIAEYMCDIYKGEKPLN